MKLLSNINCLCINAEPKGRPSLLSTDKGATPEELTTDEIACIVNDFRVASRNAIEAG